MPKMPPHQPEKAKMKEGMDTNGKSLES